MNNFLNNPALFQKALMSGLLGQILNGFGRGAAPSSGLQNGALQALLSPQNALNEGVLAGGNNSAYLSPSLAGDFQNGAYNAPLNEGNSAYNAYSGAPRGETFGQNTRHRCNLNLKEHQKYADALVSAKIIDKTTGESIKQKMAAVFKAESASSADGGPYVPEGEDFAADFSKSEFLKARECLLQYLENLDVELTSGDLAKIEEVVLQLEKAAIARNSGGPPSEFDAAGAQDPVLSAQRANEAAKERLMSSSLGSHGAKSFPQKLFTRDEISKMSTAEFIKNEPQINYQLQNGLL